MKRRIFACVLACMMILSALPVVTFAAEGTGCPGRGEKHYKENGNYTVIKVVESVCGDWGYTHVQCNTCGDKFNIDLVPPAEGAAHNWVETEAGVDATCTTAGVSAKYECSVCGKTKGGDAIAALTHHYEVTSVTNSSTAEVCSITKIETCSNCGDVKTTVISSGLHTWSDKPVRIETDPTCADNGWAVYKCSACDTEKKVYIEVTPCINLTKVDAKAPTCTEAGNVEHWVCDVCGKTYSDAAGTIALADPTIASLGHDYVTIDSKAATCTEDGYVKEQCSRCQDVKTTTVDKLDHGNATDTVVAPTCTKYGYTLSVCNDCGWSWQHTPTSPLGHTAYNDATSTNKTTVSVLGCETVGEVTWDCGRCGELQNEVTPATGHDIKTATVAATCASGSYTFTYCANAHCEVHASVSSYTNAAGRTFDVTVNGNPVHFVAMGEVDDATDPDNHDIHESITTPATCLTDGVKVIYCTRCDLRDENVAIPATGHHYDTVVSTVAPTCSDRGYTIYQCTGCTLTEKRDYVDALGHDWVDGTVVAPTCVSGGYTNRSCSRCPAVTTYKPTQWEDPAVGEWFESADDARVGHHGLCDDASRTLYRDGDCLLAGLYSYHCSDCGKNVLVRMPGTGFGHHYTIVLDPYQAPTCTADGHEAKVQCSVCNDIKGGEVISKLGHNMTHNPASTATCINQGNIENYYCDQCDKYFEDALGATEITGAIIIPVNSNNHANGLTHVAAKAATCTVAGNYEYYYCEDCGKKFTDATGTVEFSGSTDIPAAGHNVQIVDSVAVNDCENYAYFHYDCPNCEDTFDATGARIDYITGFVAATGHAYAKNDAESSAPTCTTDGADVSYCANCGDRKENVLPALGHKNAAGEILVNSCTNTVEDRHCVNCDTDIAQDHTIVTKHYDPTCIRHGYDLDYCKNCEYERTYNEGEMFGDHDWSDWNVIIPATYTTAGTKRRECHLCDAYEVEDIPTLYGIQYSLSVENAVVAGADITDSSLIAVTVTIDGRNVDVHSLDFDVAYDKDVFTFAGAELKSENLNTNFAYNDNHTAAGNYVSVVTMAPNNAEGQKVNYTVDTEEVVAVLYFRVDCVNGESVMGSIDSELSFSQTAVADAAAAIVPAAGDSVNVTVEKFLDVNNDGDVNLSDLEIAISIITGEISTSYDSVVDVNKDGVIDMNDIIAIRDYLIGTKSYKDMKKLGVAA